MGVRWLLVGLWLYGGAATAEVIQVLSYHNHPPFVTGPMQGQTYQLVRQLNALAPPGLRFQVELLPRVRLNQRLQGWIDGECPARPCDDGWLVPWVNPNWGFRPPGGDPYHWLAQAEDANVIVSRQSDPIDYQQPASLDGKVLGGVRGHRYMGIDERVAAGRIERVDGNVERDNLLMLLYGRVDAVLLPESTVNYFLQQDPTLRPHAQAFYIAPVRHQRYARSIMLPATRADLERLIGRVLEAR